MASLNIPRRRRTYSVSDSEPDSEDDRDTVVDQQSYSKKTRRDGRSSRSPEGRRVRASSEMGLSVSDIVVHSSPWLGFTMPLEGEMETPVVSLQPGLVAHDDDMEQTSMVHDLGLGIVLDTNIPRSGASVSSPPRKSIGVGSHHQVPDRSRTPTKMATSSNNRVKTGRSSPPPPISRRIPQTPPYPPPLDISERKRTNDPIYARTTDRPDRATDRKMETLIPSPRPSPERICGSRHDGLFERTQA